MWIFGYGSLIWKIDFPFKRKLPGYICGYQRRFWQGSTDHRGIPGSPGRVVTLVPSNAEDKVYGIAFEIHKHDAEDVRKHLDHREKGGYTTVKVTFHPENQNEKEFDLELYIGTEDNPNYLGPAPMDDIAKQIYTSVGPSGKNVEYLLNLAKAIRSELPGVEDPHVFELEKRILELSQNENANLNALSIK